MNNILYYCEEMEDAHRSISEKDIKQITDELKRGTLNWNTFRWLNPWIVTNGASWRIGSEWANKISKELFGINRERLRRLNRNYTIMHPGPMNRGVEISSEVADGDRAVILDQVTNGVAVRMAVLYLLSGRKETA